MGVGGGFVTNGLARGAIADSNKFPDERGFCTGVLTGTTVSYVLQDSDVVCFLSDGADADGNLHSMVQDRDAVCALPPLATVTLESVQEPGEWEANGHRIQRRLYTVRVSYQV